mmetsp:Transcript_5228/g.5867  ORF Transcript_5228/g.5867 Transcript_5228/m.5867 type:complete len:249 (-) Transcript_5228:2400-3146(-)
MLPSLPSIIPSIESDTKSAVGTLPVDKLFFASFSLYSKMISSSIGTGVNTISSNNTICLCEVRASLSLCLSISVRLSCVGSTTVSFCSSMDALGMILSTEDSCFSIKCKSFSHTVLPTASCVWIKEAVSASLSLGLSISVRLSCVGSCTSTVSFGSSMMEALGMLCSTTEDACCSIKWNSLSSTVLTVSSCAGITAGVISGDDVSVSVSVPAKFIDCAKRPASFNNSKCSQSAKNSTFPPAPTKKNCG